MLVMFVHFLWDILCAFCVASDFKKSC